jgi:Holliday junction resolvasome RuvABC endonuclease subunit
MNTTPTRILALDISGSTGWARLANGIIDHGHQSFPRYTGCKSKPADHVGQRYHAFLMWVKARIQEDKPECIVFEEPMGNFKNASARNLIVGLRGVLFACAGAYNIPVHGYPQGKLKMFATGKGNAKKPAMVAAAVKLSGGQTFASDDAADAFLVLHLHLSTTMQAAIDYMNQEFL